MLFFKTVFYVQFKQGNEIFPNLNHAKKTSSVLLVYKFFFIYQLNDFRKVFRFSGDVTYMHNVAHFNGQLCLIEQNVISKGLCSKICVADMIVKAVCLFSVFWWSHWLWCVNETISIFVYMYYTTITKEVFFGGGALFFFKGKRDWGENITSWHLLLYTCI